MKFSKIIPWITIIIALSALGFLVLYSELCNKKVTTIQNDTNIKPILAYMVQEWYVWENTAYIEGWIFNYGYTEAKNVEVSCMVFSKDGSIIKSMNKNMGNIASVSYKLTGMEIKNVYGKNRTATCVINKCEDCINLERRIQEYQKYYDYLDEAFMINTLEIR